MDVSDKELGSERDLTKPGKKHRKKAKIENI